ncbi:MAG: hypothetical protein GVY31_14750 [Alphaproteobacteria bacterium]|jgi:hypothetical protein|nr:hypothetical protein [Alphaproteobacteria bacterium]
MFDGNQDMGAAILSKPHRDLLLIDEDCTPRLRGGADHIDPFEDGDLELAMPITDDLGHDRTGNELPTPKHVGDAPSPLE